MKVLLVDDHPLVIEALETRLSKATDLEIVGKAYSGEQAIDEVARLRPDLVLIDLRMPGMGGLEAITRIKHDFPSTAVIVLTMSESQEHLLQAVLSGAAGYLTKDSSPALLLDAIHAVLGGATTIPTELLRESIRELRRGGPLATSSHHHHHHKLAEPLTEREHEVLRLLAQGHSNKVIAEMLNIVEATVKKHVHNIIRKLDVSDRTQAVIVSIRLGLVNT